MTQHILAHSVCSPTTEPWPVAETAPLILVVDDSLTVRKVVEVTLRRAGLAVLGFADGVTALRWLASSEVRIPALIYLDIELPRMDGYEVARMLRDLPRLAQTKIIMLSRRDRVLDRVKSRLAGAHDHLSKPFKTADLLALTRSVLSTLSLTAPTGEEHP